MMEPGRVRFASTSAQAEPALCCPITVSLDAVEYFNVHKWAFIKLCGFAR